MFRVVSALRRRFFHDAIQLKRQHIPLKPDRWTHISAVISIKLCEFERASAAQHEFVKKKQLAGFVWDQNKLVQINSPTGFWRAFLPHSSPTVHLTQGTWIVDGQKNNNCYLSLHIILKGRARQVCSLVTQSTEEFHAINCWEKTEEEQRNEMLLFLGVKRSRINILMSLFQLPSPSLRFIGTLLKSNWSGWARSEPTDRLVAQPTLRMASASSSSLWRLREPWQQLLLFILHLACPPPKVYPWSTSILGYANISRH